MVNISQESATERWMRGATRVKGLAMTPELIEQTVETYTDSIDRYLKLVQMVTNKLEYELRQAKILGRVNGRVKNPDSLRGKLKKFSTDEKKKERIKTPNDVFNEVSDLAAVRVTTYLEEDRERVAEIARKVFTHRNGKPDYEYDVKENDPRIKDNPHNFYRATHMQICIKPEALRGFDANLRKAHCELQITSMLAHVWNEVEHDIVYKGKDDLLPQERTAIESLGLLTKSGDNIIGSLISAGLQREKAAEEHRRKQSERFQDAASLSSFLKSYFGDKVAGSKVDFDKYTEEFRRILVGLGWDHPSSVSLKFSPTLLDDAKRESVKFTKYLQKSDLQGKIFDPSTCDFLILTTYVADFASAKKYAEENHGKRREVAMLKAYSAFKN